MKHEQFDALVRRLSGGATRRGVLGALVGIAVLPVTEVDAQRRQRAKRRQRVARRKRRGLSAQQNRARRTPAISIRQGCPEQPAQEILLLGAIGYHNSYWWDHTNLTVAVQAHPRANPDLIAATREAIAIWSQVLANDPVLSQAGVTLTDVTNTIGPARQADITLHYVPRAGGVVFEGYAICGASRCNNVLVRSDLPKPLGFDPSSPEFLAWVTLHELGHALGLGHAEPLLKTNDLMGYGWPPLEPVLSECDLRGLREVFAWAIEGTEPAPPTTVFVDCRDLCQ